MDDSFNYAEEYKRCAKDFTYFCDRYVKIRHSVKGVVPFNLYDYQKRVLKEFEQHNFNIILKFRQGGLTTISVIWAMWKAMFHLKGNQILVVSISDREAKKAGKIIDYVIDNLPEWLKPKMPGKPNAHEKIFLDTGGVVEFYTVKSARSRSLSLLIIDEAAHIKNMDDHWAALFPTLSGGGKCIVISTPNGMGGWYATEYHKAVRKENKFNVIDIDVSEHPDYRNPAWIEEQRSQLGEKKFGQEILRQFLAEGDTFISRKLISDLDLQTRNTPPVAKRFSQWDSSRDADKGAMWIWKPPVEGREYIVSADSGEGQGDESDGSAFQIIDIVDSEQVAEFCSNTIPPYTFAQILHQVATSYNHALLVVEKNGPGIATMEELERRLFYPNLYGSKARNQYKLGFRTDQYQRVAICDILQSSLLNKTIKINSSRLVKEFTTFVFHPAKKRPQATKGSHDDLIMSIGIGLKVKSDMYASIARWTPSEEQPIDLNPNKISLDLIKRELEEIFNTNIDDSTHVLNIVDYKPEIENENTNERMFNEIIESRTGNQILKEFGW